MAAHLCNVIKHLIQRAYAKYKFSSLKSDIMFKKDRILELTTNLQTIQFKADILSSKILSCQTTPLTIDK